MNDMELGNGVCGNCGATTHKKNLGRTIVEYCTGCYTRPVWRSIDKCCYNPTPELRKKIIGNGRIMVKYQCTNCGSGIGGAVKYRDTQINVDELPFYDQSMADMFYDNYIMNHSNFLEQFNKAKSEFRFAQMDEYYNSLAWKMKRSLVLRRDEYTCRSCGKAGATQVHHLTYDHFGNEPLFDLVAICDHCHEQVTKMDRKEVAFDIHH